MIEVLVSLSGSLVCAFARGLARWTGNYGDAEGLCMYSQIYDL